MSEALGRISAVLERLIDRLEASGETYALGGAVALAAWSEPRATADIDLILWVEGDGIDRAVDLVHDVGAVVDRDSARHAAERDGMFAAMAGPIRIDVFVPSIPFYAVAEKRRVRTRIAGRETWVHSAEVLAVFKLLFFRAKDLVDLERMLTVRAGRFDATFVRDSIVEMLGEDDPRVVRWDALVAATEPAEGDDSGE